MGVGQPNLCVVQGSTVNSMEYYPALKMKEIVIHTIMWMNIENILLSEIRQSQKDKYSIIPLI